MQPGGRPWERHAAWRRAALLEKARPRCRVHAACIAAPHAPCRCVALSLCCGCKNNGRCTPCACASAAGGFRQLRVGPLFELTPALKGAAKVRAVLASSPQAGFRALRAAHHSSPLLRLPKGGTPKVRCQRSSRRTGQRGLRPGCPRLVLGCQPRSLPRGAAQRAVAALWAPCFGPIRPKGAQGVQQATPAARILLKVSGQAEGSIVTP